MFYNISCLFLGRRVPSPIIFSSDIFVIIQAHDEKSGKYHRSCLPFMH